MIRSDQTLWALICQNDNKAWEELIQKYKSLVYAVLTRSGLSMHDAADCFQQIWVQLLKHKKNITQPDRLSAWLVTTAKREAIRAGKKAARETELDDTFDPVDENALPDESLKQLQLQATLENGLGHLDHRCRKLLTALFYQPEDYTYQKIADELNISINSLGPTRQRCLDKLKRLLENKL